jgi:homoserine dehydrogenase
MLAADGPRLRRVAARAGTSLRIEAAVMAGVPFIGGLERRPLAGNAARFTGVLNGTSHFVLTRIAEGLSLDGAIAEAQARGFAEPDPAADVSGADARDKLVVLAAVLLDAAMAPRDVAVDGIGDLTPADLQAAARFGGVIKPLALASRGARALAAFAGPAWLPARHPLAGISGVDNAIVIEGRHIPRLLFAGPGAGAGITAATLIDDAVEAVEGQRALCGAGREAAPCRHEAPRTGWFGRVSCPGRAREVVGGVGGQATHRTGNRDHAWVLVPPAEGDGLTAQAAALESQGAAVRLWRALDVPAR